MNKSDKTREQLLKELEKSNKRIVELEKSETERKRAGVALRESEERYRAIFEDPTSANIYFDMEGRFISVNEKAAQIIGKSVKDVIGKYVKEVYSPRSVDVYLERLRHAMETGETVEYADFIEPTDKWFSTRVVPIQDESGKIRGIQTSTRDITKHKQVEETLRKSEEKFRDIVEMSPAGIMTISLKGFFTSCNPAFLKLTGYKYDDLIGKHFTKLPTLRLKDIPRYIRMLESLIKGEKFKPFEFKWVHKNGKVLLGEAQVSILRKKGKITGFQIIATDITERKQVEEALKESELWSKEIFESSLDAIFIADSNSYFIDVNKAAASLTGYSKDELLKMSIPDLHEEKDLEAYNKFFKCIMDGESITSEAKILRKDGTKVDVEFNNKRFIIGSVSYMHSIARDVTKRKQVEKKLRGAEANLKNTFDISPGLICVADANTGYFTECNLAVTRILGFSVEEFTSRPFMEFVHPDDRQKTTDEITRQLRGKPVANFENRYRNKDGSYKWLAWQATAADKNGKVHAVATDITERKQAEEELFKSEEKHRTLFETMAQGVVYQDKDGKITSTNPAAERILGLTLDQMQGRKSIDPRWRAIHEDGSDFPGDTHPSMIALKTGKEVNNVKMGVFNTEMDEYRLISINARLTL